MESGGGGNGGPRRLLLADRKVNSRHLRDLLRVKQDDDDGSSDKRLFPARTLLDIIRDEPYSATENRKSWRVFGDKLRLRSAGHAWISTVRSPSSDVPIPNTDRTISRGSSTHFQLAAVNSEDASSHSIRPSTSGENRAQLNPMPTGRAMMLRPNSGRGTEGSTSSNTRDNNAGEGAGETAEEPPLRTSLMALLAESERQLSSDGSGFMMNDEEEEEEEIAGGGYNNCCVCMVRHKGAAFIPCGHTFCRLCSRELWVQRGNCPICNGFISEVLDIF